MRVDTPEAYDAHQPTTQPTTQPTQPTTQPTQPTGQTDR